MADADDCSCAQAARERQQPRKAPHQQPTTTDAEKLARMIDPSDAPGPTAN